MRPPTHHNKHLASSFDGGTTGRQHTRATRSQVGRVYLRCSLATSSPFCCTFLSRTVSSLRRAYDIRRRVFSTLDSSPRRYTHCAWVFDAPLHFTLLHLRICILGGGHPRDPMSPSSRPPFRPMSRLSFRGAAYFRADDFFASMTDCARMVIQWGVAEVRWMYVRVRVYMPWKERNTRERRMGGEMEPGGRRRTHCDAGSPPCGRPASGWDGAFVRLPARGESPPGQLIHSSL
ncbi:hypothetical protein B0H13DRAFT_2665802 [Mycena leptocephala]|nr:hypothetical protein B0H13DRAFT_2665802 [Mycena leptocephala]